MIGRPASSPGAYCRKSQPVVMSYLGVFDLRFGHLYVPNLHSPSTTLLDIGTIVQIIVPFIKGNLLCQVFFGFFCGPPRHPRRPCRQEDLKFGQATDDLQ